MDFSQLRKLESHGAESHSYSPDARLTGIIKVKSAGYHPKGVEVRAQIGTHMFTAEFCARDVADLEKDPKVETISVSQPLPLQKLPTPAG